MSNPHGMKVSSRHEYSGFVHGALGRSVLFRGCGGEHRSLITLLTNSSQGRGCRHGNEVAGTSSILLVFFSQRCQGRLRCGTVRTLTGTHLWHTNAQTSARSGSSQHDYMTPTVMPSVFAEEQTEKRKTLLFHGPRFRFVLWLWFDKPTHTYFVHYITLPVRKDNCNCKTHHSPEVWAGNTEDYTFVHSSAIYTNTAWMCNTLQQAVRAVSPASPAKTADALMQKNTAALMAKQEDGSVSQKTKFNAFTPQQHHCSARACQTPAPWSCNSEWVHVDPFHLFWWSCRVTVKIHLIIFKFMRFLSH